MNLSSKTKVATWRSSWTTKTTGYLNSWRMQHSRRWWMNCRRRRIVIANKLFSAYCTMISLVICGREGSLQQLPFGRTTRRRFMICWRPRSLLWHLSCWVLILTSWRAKILMLLTRSIWDLSLALEERSPCLDRSQTRWPLFQRESNWVWPQEAPVFPQLSSILSLRFWTLHQQLPTKLSILFHPSLRVIQVWPVMVQPCLQARSSLRTNKSWVFKSISATLASSPPNLRWTAKAR